MQLNTRRHWPIAAVFVLSIALLLFMGGETRVSAVLSDSYRPSENTKHTIAGTVDLFDNSIVHTISIELGAENRQRMESTYRETGRKDWFAAAIIIDGTKIGKVGIRLKGNSTLESIYGQPKGTEETRPLPGPAGSGSEIGAKAGSAAGAGAKAGSGRHSGSEPEPGLAQDITSERKAPQGQTEKNPQDSRSPPSRQAPLDGGIDESRRDPDRNTPYLVKFDKYTPGLSYQGHSEIALRVRGHQKEDAALLAELVTRDALSRAGIAVPALACTGLTVDGADETLYLVSEHLDDDYIEKTTGKASSESILYKALPKSQFVYRGEDPSAYATTFSQETNRKRDDLAPLIDLLRFVTEADDETYRSGISNFIDQETLAAYLAANNILVNIDSLGGNGNNYYLLYDKESKKFKVLAWDMNESLGQFWMSPSDPATLGSSYDMESPIRHPLLERSLADPDFLALYENKRATLADELLMKGTAFDLIDHFRTMMESTENASRNLITADEYRASVTWAQAFLARRKDYFTTGNR